MIKKNRIAVLILLSGLFIPLQLNGTANKLTTCVKAPRFMQNYFYKCIKTQHAPYSTGNWLKRTFMWAFGFSTVYIGTPKLLSKHFENHPDVPVFSNGFIPSRGVYLNPKYFTCEDKKLSDKQRFLLAHESVHINRGPNFHSNLSIAWFIEEYIAQSRAVEITFKHGDYSALANGALDFAEASESCLPYLVGVIDGFHMLVKNNPEIKPLKSIVKWFLADIKIARKNIQAALEKDDLYETAKKDLQYHLASFNMIIEIYQAPKKKKVATLEERIEQYKKTNTYQEFIKNIKT